MARKVVDARADEMGNITAVLLEGNSRFTSQKTAIGMAERGEIENTHAVHPQGGDPYLRSNPDSKKRNNLDEMAKD